MSAEITPNQGTVGKHVVRSRRLLWFAAILVVAVIGAYAYWVASIPSYLIPGVPYYGIYSGTVLWSDTQTALAMAMRYWGDERVSDLGITEDAPSVTTPTLDSIVDILRRYGYSADLYSFRRIRDFTQFVNARRKTPLIVVHKLSNRDDLPPLYVYSVLIGVDSSRDEITLHNSILGNNYRIAFSDFEKRTEGARRQFVAAVPHPSIRDQLRPPSTRASYPPRKAIMDAPEDLDLQLRWLALMQQRRDGADPRIMLAQWQELESHPAFLRLHPAARIVLHTNVAREHRRLGEYAEAIRVIEEFALPLNHDLNQPYGEWDRDPAVQRETDRPWLSLARTYMEMSALSEARRALNRAFAITPTDPNVHREIQRWEELTAAAARLR